MDLLCVTADTRAMRDSKKGASKQFLKDFDKAFKKRSKELGYGKLDKTVKTYNIQVSPPRDFGKPIDREKRKGVEVDYQVGDSVTPGRKLYEYPLEDFIKAKVSSISTSPERDDTILIEDPFKT